MRRKLLVQVVDTGAGLAINTDGESEEGKSSAQLIEEMVKMSGGSSLQLAQTLLSQHGGCLSLRKNTPSGCTFMFTMDVELNVRNELRDIEQDENSKAALEMLESPRWRKSINHRSSNDDDMLDKQDVIQKPYDMLKCPSTRYSAALTFGQHVE